MERGQSLGGWGDVSRETIPFSAGVSVKRSCFSPSDRPPHVPFRPHFVILTHRRSRAHQRSCAVSEESPNFKANPSSTCGDSSSQAPQNDNEKRNDEGQPSETAIVSRETKPRKPLSFLIRARMNKQIPPHEHASNAECAPESPPQGRRLVCACFGCTCEDRARLAPFSGSSCQNLSKRARRKNRFSIQ